MSIVCCLWVCVCVCWTDNTKKATFYGNYERNEENTIATDIDLMHEKGDYHYCLYGSQGNNFHIVRFDYFNSDISLYIALPHKHELAAPIKFCVLFTQLFFSFVFFSCNKIK